MLVMTSHCQISPCLQTMQTFSMSVEPPPKKKKKLIKKKKERKKKMGFGMTRGKCAGSG